MTGNAIRVGFLLSTGCLSAMTATGKTAGEAESGSEIFDLDPLVVETTAFTGPPEGIFGENAAGHRLREARPGDMAENLSHQLEGIALIRKGGTSNDLAIRGLSGEDLTVTVDGRKIQGACSNRMDPAASHAVPAEVKVVQIQRGAFDLRRSGSLGGAVDFRTGTPAPEFNGFASARLGSHGERRFALTSTGGTKTFPGWLSVTHHAADVYRDGNDQRLTDFPDATAWPLDDYLPGKRDIQAFTMIHGALKLGYEPKENHALTGSFRFREDEDVLYPGLRMDSDSTRAREMGLRYRAGTTPLGDELVIDLYHNWTDHDMRDRHRVSSRKNPMGMPRPVYVLERGWFMESLGTSSTSGLTTEAQNRLGDIRFEYGTEATLRRWNIDNRLGAGGPDAGPAAEITNNMIPSTRVRVVGAWIQSSIDLATDLRLLAGLRLDRFRTEAEGSTDFLNSQRGGPFTEEDTECSAMVFLQRSWNERLFLHTGIGSIARVPSGQERYMQLRRPGSMPNWLGNPRLRPARNTEWSAGAAWRTSAFSLRLRAWHSWLSDAVYPGRLLPDDEPRLAKPTQTWFNIDARRYGLEAGGSLRLHAMVSLEAGLSVQEGRKESRPPNASNDRFAEVPPLNGRLALRVTRDRLTLLLEGRFADSQDRIDPDLNELSLGSYSVFDLRGSLQLTETAEVLFSVTNLFDETYAVHNARVRNPFASFTVVNEPGRAYTLSLRYRF
ncbi:MAG: TonB-dependent receptor [Verrucomicrobia bacterium]|jgi:iron complex outermembrane receptor protein|nr:TonB-dependent receptor [Verrucomicrobiota bacterium]